MTFSPLQLSLYAETPSPPSLPEYLWTFDLDPLGAIPIGSPVIPTEEVRTPTYNGNGPVGGGNPTVAISAGIGPSGPTQYLELGAAAGSSSDIYIPDGPFSYRNPLATFAGGFGSIGDFREGLTLSMDFLLNTVQEDGAFVYDLILDTGLRFVPTIFRAEIRADLGGTPNLDFNAGFNLSDTVPNTGIVLPGVWYNMKVSWKSIPQQDYRVSINGAPLVNYVNIPIGVEDFEGFQIFTSMGVPGFAPHFIADNFAAVGDPFTALVDNVKFESGFNA